LTGTDSAITKRTWQEVMDDIIKDKQGPTLRRWRIAIRDKAFVLIRHRVVIETLPEELLLVLRTGKVSTNVYLRRRQNHCLGMGWLPAPLRPAVPVSHPGAGGGSGDRIQTTLRWTRSDNRSVPGCTRPRHGRSRAGRSA